MDTQAGTEDLAQLLERIPVGWTRVSYRGRPYGLSRTDLVDGRSVAVYAEELGGNDVVSANVYRTSTGDNLRACEMPAAVVTAFLRGWTHPASAMPTTPRSRPATEVGVNQPARDAHGGKGNHGMRSVPPTTKTRRVAVTN